jgi:hypothetical protein
MTIRAPGEECLTQTQIAQRELLAQVRQKQETTQTAPLKPVDNSEKAGTTQSYGSPHSRLLDITV